MVAITSLKNNKRKMQCVQNGSKAKATELFGLQMSKFFVIQIM